MLNHIVPPELIKMLVKWPERLNYDQNKNAQSFSVRIRPCLMSQITSLPYGENVTETCHVLCLKLLPYHTVRMLQRPERAFLY